MSVTPCGPAPDAHATKAAAPPNAVRYNEWPMVDAAPRATFVPRDAVSVVVPRLAAPAELAAVLASLERQTYPRELFEVVLVDGGSRPPHGLAPTPLDVRMVREPGRGCGLAAARNLGARAARHDILVFLDGDTVAGPELLAAHARWHHAVGDALTLGTPTAHPPARIDPATPRGHGALAPPRGGEAGDAWCAYMHIARRDDLTSRHDDVFRAIDGSNFGVRKAFYEALGGCEESFAHGGGEDIEFAFRAYTAGGLLVPACGADARRAGGPQAAGAADERARATLADRIPHPAFRNDAPGRTFRVPAHVVTVRAGRRDRGAQRTVRDLLADPAGDLIVRVETEGASPDAAARLADEFARDSRVSVSPIRSALEKFPATPLHVVLPAGTRAPPGSVRALARALRTAAHATVRLDDGRTGTIARAWALHRAHRTGGAAGDFGDAVTFTLAEAQRFAHPQREGGDPAPQLRAPGAQAARALAELRQVRGPRSTWQLMRRIALGVRRRMRPGRAPPAPGDDALGVRILVAGARARLVFGDSPGVMRRARGHVDVVLADDRNDAAGFGAPAVVLAQAPGMLAVPALNPRRHAPAGWVRDVENGAASLGHDDLLGVEVGVRYESVGLAERDLLRRCHHVEDVAAYHPDPVARAGVLVRLAAMGVPVFLADGGPGLEALLGAELHRLMRADLRNADIAERERLSIRMRRAALREHSRRARARQICEAAGLPRPPPPRVAVLVVADSGRRLASALANVARQTYPNLALVLALRGGGVEADLAALDALPYPAEAVRIDGGRYSGNPPNAPGAALVATMDGRDLYGSEHVWDLVLAHEYSAAALVAKAAETLYLRERDVTVRCGIGAGERYGPDGIAGGAMLVERDAFDRAQGWRRVALGAHRQLIDEIAASGAGVYRTHGAGYIAVRQAPADAALAHAANAEHAGWHPDLADINDALAPGAAGGGATATGVRQRVSRASARTGPHPLRPASGSAPAIAWSVSLRRRRIASNAPAPYCRHARAVARALRGTGAGSRREAHRFAASMIESAPTAAHREVAEALARALADADDSTAQRIARTAVLSGEPRAEKILSRRYAFVWICNPKVASRSIIRALATVDPHAELIAHATLDEMFAYCPEARSYFTFAFVRHPYPRTHSFHVDCGPDGEKRRRLLRSHYGICGDGSFAELCEWLNTPWGSDAFADRHWLSQHLHLRLPDGRLPDFVGRHETLEQDFATLAERVGTALPPLPLLNRMTGTLGSDRVLEAARRLRGLHLNKTNRALIRQRYACDFKTWGFAP